jgi:hypothetical protein
MLAMHLALIQIKQKNKQLKSKKIYKKKFKKDIIEIVDILIPFRF